MHITFSFPLLYCYSAMDVLQMQMQRCNKCQKMWNLLMHITFSFPLLHCYSAMDECQNNQDRYIAEILILPINLRYIQKRVPALVHIDRAVQLAVITNYLNGYNFFLMNMIMMMMMTWYPRILHPGRVKKTISDMWDLEPGLRLDHDHCQLTVMGDLGGDSSDDGDDDNDNFDDLGQGEMMRMILTMIMIAPGTRW